MRIRAKRLKRFHHGCMRRGRELSVGGPAAVFASAKQQGAGAPLGASGPFFNSRSAQFVTLAAQCSIPTIYRSANMSAAVA
jgi:hypothetical protein